MVQRRGRRIDGRSRGRNVRFAGARDHWIDNFDDQSLSEYTGDTGSYSFDTSTVDQGDASLTISGSTASDQNIQSSSGLDNYPSRGDIWRYKVRINNTSITRANLMFFTTDAGNTYTVAVEPGTGDFQINVWTSSSVDVVAADTTVTYSTGVWYEVEVDTSDTANNTIAAKLIDDAGNTDADISGTDSTYDTGDVGWQYNGGDASHQAWFDNARITG